MNHSSLDLPYALIGNFWTCLKRAVQGTVFAHRGTVPDMPVSKVDAMFGRPGWPENFQAWVARLSPAIPAGLNDV
jgi:hypothetical protein